MERLKHKVDRAISNNEPLLCIGYQLPDFSLSDLIYNWEFTKPVYFSGSQFLGKTDFSGAKFKEANFYQAKFQEADFSGANFLKANFIEANLQRDQTVGIVPPSITYSLPLIDSALSETRNATSSATSSGRPGRPIGIPPRDFINA